MWNLLSPIPVSNHVAERVDLLSAGSYTLSVRLFASVSNSTRVGTRMREQVANPRSAEGGVTWTLDSLDAAGNPLDVRLAVAPYELVRALPFVQLVLAASALAGFTDNRPGAASEVVVAFMLALPVAGDLVLRAPPGYVFPLECLGGLPFAAAGRPLALARERSGVNTSSLERYVDPTPEPGVHARNECDGTRGEMCARH